MKSYALCQTSAARALVRGLLPAFAFAALVLTGIVWSVAWYGNAEAEFYLHLIPVLILILPFSCWLVWRRQRRAVKSYRIVLDGEELIRVLHGFPNVVIRQDEITTIEERAEQGLVIRTNDPRKVIGVPVTLEGYDELRNLLANVCPIEFRSPNAGRREMMWRIMWLATIMIVTFLAFFVTFFSNNRYAVAPAALFLTVLLVGGGILIQRSPIVDRSTKAISWVAFLPLPAIIIRLIWALFF